MKKNKMRVMVAVVSLYVICSFVVAFFISKGTIDGVLYDYALSTVEENSIQQVDSVNHNLEFQFVNLETFADYLGKRNSAKFEDVEKLMRSLLNSNKFCTIAYTNEDGDILGAVSADNNPPSGNISDRKYFKDAMYYKDTRAVQYMSKTAMTSDPRVLFAVPIIRDDDISGVVFASLEQDFFEEKIWSFDKLDILSVIITSDGTIIADTNNRGEIQNGINIFDEYIQDDDAETIKKDMELSQSGKIILDNPVRYISYQSLDVNDWYVVSVIDNNILMSAYDKSMKKIENGQWIIAILFASCLLIMLFVIVFHVRRQRRRYSVLSESKQRYLSFLENSGNASFEYDVANLTLHPSEKLNKIIGYDLPESFMSSFAERAKEHPEFDYNGLMEAFNDTLLSGEYKEFVSSLRTKEKGLRYLKMSLISTKNAEGKMSTIIGTVSDVTSAYQNERLTKKEQDYITNETLSFIPMSVSVNLTQGTYSMINRAPDILGDYPWKGSYNDIARDFGKAVSEEHRDNYNETFNSKNLLNAYKNGTKIIDSENLFVTKSGEKKWMLSRVFFVDEPTDDDVRALILTIDISKQKENAVLIQKSFDVVTNNMTGYVCKCKFTPDDIILINANNPYYHFMKTSKDLAIGASVFYGNDSKHNREIFDELYVKAKKKDTVNYSGYVYKYNGEKFWASISGAYLHTEDGYSVYMCVISDMSSAVENRERALEKSEEFKLVAEMSNSIILKYDVRNKKIYVLSNYTGMDELSQINGHAPEYAIEHGLITLTEEGNFYNTISAIENGETEGDIKFVITIDGKYYWAYGKYKTMFNESGAPASAIIIIKEKTDLGVFETAKTLNAFYGSGDSSALKMLIINLSQDRIEYENDVEERFFSDEGIVQFSEAKEKILERGEISTESKDEWTRHLDAENLKRLYKKGVFKDKFTCCAKTAYGNRREVVVETLLQESRYDKNIRAYIVFKDKQAYKSVNSTPAEKDKETKEPPRVSIRAFGYFDVFVNGKPIAFAHDKAKEMLAVLVDRRGGFVSSSEMISMLWEDETSNKTTQSRCRQVASRLKMVLEENGIGDIIEVVNGKRRIIPEKVDCDYFKYYENNPSYKNLFNGSYMLNYSWSEYTLMELENNRSLM